MNKEETEEEELIEYFEEMCNTLSSKKIMFREWEDFYKKLNEVITNNNNNEKYTKYVDALKYAFVYFEDYGDERSYRKCMMTLKTFSNNKNS